MCRAFTISFAVSVLLAQSATAQMVRYRLDTADTRGNPIDQVDLQQEFELRIWVQDIRSVPRGVVSAYVDVVYDPALTAVVPGSLRHGPAYGTIGRGNLDGAGLLDEVGSFADGYLNLPPLPNPLGGTEALLFSARFAPREPGIASFASDGADILPLHSTTVLDLDGAVPADQTVFGHTRIVIVPEAIGPATLVGVLVLWQFLTRERHRPSTAPPRASGVSPV
jgi:hypothetical protein